VRDVQSLLYDQRADPGSCKHQHVTIYDAYSCLGHDFRMAQKEGLGSDRRVCAVEAGHERELSEQEINQLEQWSRFVSLEIIKD